MPRTQHARDEKRDRILVGAIRAFAAKGFHQTRVSDVAKAAGVADGTIYLYFDNKEALLAAIFDAAMARFLRRGETILSSIDNPLEQLEILIRLHFEALGEDRELAVVFQIDLRHSLQFLQGVSRGILRRYFEAITQIIDSGQRQGVFADDIPAPDAARLVFGILDEVSTTWVLSNRNYRLETWTKPATTFILRGLAASSGVQSAATQPNIVPPGD